MANHYDLVRHNVNAMMGSYRALFASYILMRAEHVSIDGGDLVVREGESF